MAETPTPEVVRDEFTEPFWDGLSEHLLRLQWCEYCAAAVFYPRALCPRCHTTDLRWTEVSGRGQVYSYTIVRRATPPFGTHPPFVVTLVDLDEGVRMLGKLRGVALAEVRIGLPVTVDYTTVGELTVIAFRPAEVTSPEGA